MWHLCIDCGRPDAEGQQITFRPDDPREPTRTVAVCRRCQSRQPLTAADIYRRWRQLTTGETAPIVAIGAYRNTAH